MSEKNMNLFFKNSTRFRWIDMEGGIGEVWAGR